jgi:hypothetical protein
VEIKNIVLHFPWGAGGNFVRNCLLLDSRYEFDWEDRTTEQRYQHLVEFYQWNYTQQNWLLKEWAGPRGWLYQKYYKEDHTFNYNTDQPVIFVSHGETALIESMLTTTHLEHVFLTASDPEFIAKTYVSKSPQADGHLRGTIPERVDSSVHHIKQFSKFVAPLVHSIDNPRMYDANQLFENHGYCTVLDIIHALDFKIESNLIEELHGIWNVQNKKLYRAMFENNG